MILLLQFTRASKIMIEIIKHVLFTIVLISFLVVVLVHGIPYRWRVKTRCSCMVIISGEEIFIIATIEEDVVSVKRS